MRGEETPWDRRASGERLRRSRRCSAHGTRLRDAAGETPGIADLPHTPGEQEKIDWKRAAPRRERHHRLALTDEAAGFEHTPRGRVDDPRRGREFVSARVVDQRPRGLGGVAMTPVRHADPKAEMRSPGIRGAPGGRPD